jgi:anti-sigma B factor antagonist
VSVLQFPPTPLAWVHVTGEVDMATAPQLVRTLGERLAQAVLVVLDLREVTFMDTCGVHAIVDATARARRAGRRLVILRGPPHVDRLLTLTAPADAVEIGAVDAFESPARLSVDADVPHRAA